ncbi:flavin-dependent dehydrogenase [Azospirillum agricola]|uniref:FAD-dependent oxidoreductase n=1 Tax=Azospirillum agricola TaxID=1720247 RepID=UPI001AE832E6|nr:FAD-dependent oxidoreductase [Azospirillum agricola]MBP2230474.1 flavin-dependent dehydrogenase [Azospirillum agricola]
MSPEAFPGALRDAEAADVLIVGAGPAGSATALALRAAGVPRVLLVDRAAHGSPERAALRVGESAAPNVGPLLARLGLPDDLERLGHRPYHGNLSLWSGGEVAADDFLRRGSGHGWHLDRARFDQWLRDAAAERGARLLAPASLAGIERRPEGGWTVGLRDPSGGRGSVTARVVVDAGGRRAPLATALGARRRRLDRLIALAVEGCPAGEPAGGGFAGRSFVEAVEIGWWYAAVLPSGRAIVTLMTDDDIARTAGLGGKDAFRSAWAATARLRDLVPPPGNDLGGEAAPAVFPAASQHIDRAVGAGWIVVGDALIGFDPLTSSGIAGALDDGLAAADTILRWFSGDGAEARAAAIGYARRAGDTLRRYLAERTRHYAAGGRWPDAPFWSRRAAR